VKDIASVVRAMVAREFRIPADTVRDETSAADVAGWDSFSNGSLLLRIEGELGFELPLDDALATANVGELIEVITRAAKARR
jgi:acyl carrier protein